MFSLDRQYGMFLADLAKVLLTVSTVRVVYLAGLELQLVTGESSHLMRVVPNFVVRTTDPLWQEVAGSPHGRAGHDLIELADAQALEEFLSKWYSVGLTPAPTFGELQLIFGNLSDFVRIVEVPATASWAGPEYLGEIPDGISVERPDAKSLRRYNAAIEQLEPPADYRPIDESYVE